MNTGILRISSIAYFISFALYYWVSSNPSSSVDPVISNYIYWWYSQPLTALETWLFDITIYIAYLSVFFSIALVFIKKWAAIGFLICTGILFVAELFLPHSFPLSRLEVTLEAIAGMAIASVLVLFLLDSKLNTFKV